MGGGGESPDYMQELEKKSYLNQIQNTFLGIGANLCRPVKAGEKVLNHVALKRKPYVYLLLFIYQWQGSL